MVDVNSALAANRDAIADLIGAAEQSEGAWTTPRAPGRWSPSQVVEHVARSLDESANVMAGAPSKFPNLPFFLRPVARSFLFNRVLKRGTFPKAKTNKALDPAGGPATPADARVRLDGAFTRFDRACRACAEAGETVASATFGNVPLVDYARFMEVHTRHHRRQLPGAADGRIVE